MLDAGFPTVMCKGVSADVFVDKVSAPTTLRLQIVAYSVLK